MPIKHAALRQMRKDRVRRIRNQSVRSEIRTLTKQFIQLVQSQKLDEAGRLLRRVASTYDRAASKGVIHRNTASRYKSRLTKRLTGAKAS